jgi:gliding motility-associated-like protein
MKTTNAAKFLPPGKTLLLALLCLSGLSLFAQPFTNAGKEFWVGYGHHQAMEKPCPPATGTSPNTMDMVLYISAPDQTADVTIQIDRSGIPALPNTWWTRKYTVNAGTVISTQTANAYFQSGGAGLSGPFPKGTAGTYDSRLWTDAPPLGTGGEGKFLGKGIHITSNVPIVVYAHIYDVTNTGATMLMPVHTWGYSYTSMNSQQAQADRSYSWMYVVAKDSNTRIQITPSQISRLGKPAGVPFTIDLQKGEIYQYIADAPCATGTGPEATGTTVKSIAGPDGKCHQIAVFSGSSRTAGEVALCPGGNRDNDMQQVFPEHAWGQRYLTAPFSRGSGSSLFLNSFQNCVYKVLVKDPTTIVRRNGVQLTNLSTNVGNKYYKFLSNTADYITADKPVMMAQFMATSGSSCNPSEGDPEMIVLSPIEQSSKKVAFYRNDEESINTNFATIIVPTPGLPSMRIDNNLISGQPNVYTYAHPNRAGYSVVVKGWTAAKAQATISCDSGFNAITYGLGGAESYGYNAGTNIINLNGIGVLHNVYDSVNTTNLFTCTKTPVELSALISYQPNKLVWELSKLTDTITPNLDVTQNNPVPVSTQFINGITYYKYTLPGEYVFNTVGTHYIPVQASSVLVDICTRVEELTLVVEVKPSPNADFTFTQSGCNLSTVNFFGKDTSSNGYPLKNWRWEFPDATKDSAKNPVRVFPNSGPHNIYHKVISKEGCVGDTTRAITLANVTPTTSITATSTNICEGGSTTLTASFTGGGTPTYTWSPATGLNTTTGATVIASPLDTTVYTVTAVDGSCTGTATITINVTAKPAKPFAPSPLTACQGGGAPALTATALPGNTLTWYTNAGLTGGTATPPPVSTATAGTFYYYVTQSTSAGCISLDSMITVVIQPSITGNTIGADQTLCSGTAPNPLTGTATVAGGDNTFTYQWEQSTDNGVNWTTIATNGTSANYAPGNINGTVKFRRIVTSGQCTNTSNVVTVTIQGTLGNFEIAAVPAVCEGTRPAIIDGQAPTGGNGTFTYQWESSQDNTTWSVISGETAEDYWPPVLVNSTYFRRKVTSGLCSGYSASVQVVVNPLPTGSITTANSEICSNEAASVSFTATTGTAPFNLQLTITAPGGYSNTITQSVSSGPTVINVLPVNSSPNIYTVTITSLTDSKGCVRNSGMAPVTITVKARPVVTVPTPPAICEGAPGATLNAASNVAGTSFSWSPATGLSATTGATVIATPAVTTQYKVVGTAAGCLGDTTYVTVTVNPKPAIPAATSPLNYAQGSNPSPGLTATATGSNTLTWYTNASLTGGSSTPPPINTNTPGVFYFYVTQTTPQGCMSADSMITVNIQAGITGNTIGNDQTVCGGTSPNPITGTGTLAGGNGTYNYQWQQSTDGGSSWTNTGSNTDTHAPGAAIGTIKFRRIVTSGLSTDTSNIVTITVQGLLTNYEIAAAQEICSGSRPAILIGQTPSGGTGAFVYQWESSSDNSSWTVIAGETAKDYWPPTLTTNTYYRRKVTSGLCSGYSASVLITVNPLPNGSLSTATSAICSYDAASVTFTSSAGTGPYNVQLTITAPGGFSNVINQSGVTSGGSISVLPANSTPDTYTVTITSLTDAKGCVRTTGMTPVTITVNPKPVVTVPTPPAICEATTGATLTATSNVSGTTFAWTPSTGLSATTGATVTATPTATTIYNVTGTASGCVSDATPVTVTVNPKPAPPTGSGPFTVCQGSMPAPVLTATATGTNTLTWYDNAGLTGGTATAPPVPTSTAGTFNYYVTQTTPQGCISNPTIVTVTVQPSITGNTIANDQTVCSGTPLAAITDASTVSGGNGTYNYQWQQSTNGGASWSLIIGSTSAGFTPPSVVGTVLYRRSISSGTCSSVSNSVSITVQPALSNFQVSASQEVCAGSPVAMLDGQAASGGDGTFVYQWESSVDNATWSNAPGASTNEDYQPTVLTQTTYYRRKITSGFCSGYSASVTITVNPLPNAAIAATPATICQYDAATVSFTASAGTAPYTIQLNVTGPGGYNNTINQSGVAAGPVNINILPAGSAAGSYTVTISSLTDSKGCVRTTGMTPVTITVNPKPVVSVPTPPAICEATTGAALNATSTVAGTTFTWTPSTGLSATTGANVTATPTVTTVYKLAGVAAGCLSDTVNVTVTVNPKPAPPTGSGPFTYCQNTGSAPMTANATGANTLTWYDNAGLTGGTPTAPPVPTATAGQQTYYVTQTTPQGCVSDPTIISVTIQPQISGNTIGSDVTLCMGQPSPQIGSANPPTGGNNSYSYVWEQSKDNGATWTTTSGTGLNFTPGILNETTLFRRLVASGLCNNTSNIVTIFIQSPISNTAIDGDRTVCQGGTPAPLIGPAAAGGSGTFSYQWEQSTDNTTWTAISGATNKDYAPPAMTVTTWYRRQVTGGSCSAVSAAVKVTVNPIPNGAITGPAPICTYDAASVIFTGSGAAPFTVDLSVTAPGGATSSITQTVPNTNAFPINIVPANSAAGNYVVTILSVRDNNNCPRITGFGSPVTIVVNQKPVVTTNTPSSFCEGTTGTQITATSNVAGTTTFVWSPSAGLNTTTGSTVMASPATTTTYSVVGTTNGCISDPATVTVNVDPKPAKPAVVRPVTYCQNANANDLVASASPGHTLTWYSTYPSAGQATPFKPLTGTNGSFNYYVTQTSAAGCTSDTAIITVTVSSSPVVTFTMPTALCMSEDGSGTATFNSTSSVADNSTLSYVWSFGDGQYGTGRTPSHLYTLTRPYTDQQVILTVTSANNCSSSDTNILLASVFHDKPIAKFAVSDTVLCNGKMITFTDQSTGATGMKSWSWNFGDVTSSTLKNPAKQYTRPGNYLVQLVVADSAGCTSDPEPKNIVVNLQPVIDAGQNYYVMQGSTIRFNPRVNDSVQVSFLWTPSMDFANPTVLRPTLKVMRDQRYTLTAVGPGGCTAVDTMTVFMLQPVVASNAFSPNGDGINDRWVIPNLSKYPGAVVDVFNRYGQKVFTSTGYATPWDGKFNGQSLPVATYYYIITLKNGFAPITGSVTIIK